MPPRTFCQRLPAFRLPRARARSVHPSILPSRSRSSRGRGTVENRNIQPRQELFGVFAGAVLCGISGFCLDGLWKSASGGGFGGIFGCPAAFRPRQTGRCGRIFFCFLWESRGFCPPAFVDIRWGLRLAWGICPSGFLCISTGQRGACFSAAMPGFAVCGGCIRLCIPCFST